MQTDNVRASFTFVGDLNGHHRDWLGSTTINRHRVAAVDFATVSDCGQLVVSPTHANGGALDLLMTDVPYQVRIAVVASIGNSDHSSLSVVISMAQVVPNSCVSKIFFLKHHIKSTGMQSVVQYRICPGVPLGLLQDNPVEVCTNICPCWLDVMHQPRSSECLTRINLGMMHAKVNLPCVLLT